MYSARVFVADFLVFFVHLDLLISVVIKAFDLRKQSQSPNL